jgi:uncharacterized protein YkwD
VARAAIPLRQLSKWVIVLVSLALASCTPANAPATVQAGAGAAQERGLARAVNEHRASIHLPPLRWDAGLAAMARRHSRDMASGRVPFGHHGFERRIVGARRLGYRNVAENLGTSNAAPDSAAAVAMNGFLLVAPYRHALEGPYRRTGVGVARDSAGFFFFTQLFAR